MTCVFNNYDWGFNIGVQYQCEAERPNNLIVTSPADREIMAVSGSHLIGKTNADIKAIFVLLQNVSYFPLNIGKFFSNIEVVEFKLCPIQEVRKKDFSNLKNLKYLFIISSNIKVLEANLFALVPNLKTLYLNNNQIAKIAPTVFDIFVNKLEYFNLAGNVCPLGTAVNDIPGANAIIASVQSGSC